MAGEAPSGAVEAVAAAARIAAHPALRALAWHCHHCLFCAGSYPWDRIRQWPTLEGTLGDTAGMFYVLALLSGVPGMRAIHEARGIPPGIVRDTVSQIQARL